MKSSLPFLSLLLLATSGLAADPLPPKEFATPVDAAEAFIAAAKTGETAALLPVFGDQFKDIMETADPDRDRELRARAAAMAAERRQFRINGENSVTMVIGAEAWPFPIPIIKTANGWHFDTASGIQEIVKRRIGENELTVIASMKEYVAAQFAYAREARGEGALRQFARRFISSPGKNDGLHWPVDPEKGGDPSPAGPEIQGGSAPYAGYYFKILTAQGAAAPAGKYNYLINGHFIGGFALIAWPAEYGKTGVMTFMVNHYGEVMERDFGPETAGIAKEIEAYNPTSEWKPVAE